MTFERSYIYISCWYDIIRLTKVVGGVIYEREGSAYQGYYIGKTKEVV